MSTREERMKMSLEERWLDFQSKIIPSGMEDESEEARKATSLLRDAFFCGAAASLSMDKTLLFTEILVFLNEKGALVGHELRKGESPSSE